MNWNVSEPDNMVIYIKGEKCSVCNIKMESILAIQIQLKFIAERAIG